jgi:hypothetical protein
MPGEVLVVLRLAVFVCVLAPAGLVEVMCAVELPAGVVSDCLTVVGHCSLDAALAIVPALVRHGSKGWRA